MSDLGGVADGLPSPAGHRGTQESDLILADLPRPISLTWTAHSWSVSRLLDCADPDRFDWTIGGSTPPEEYDHDVPVTSLLRSTRQEGAQPCARDLEDKEMIAERG